MFKFRWAGMAMVAVGLPALAAVGCGSDGNEVPSEGGTGGGDAGANDADAAIPTFDGAVTVGLGAICGADTDCVAGLTCTKPSDNLLGVGPANGYCTRTCTQNIECFGFAGECWVDSTMQGKCLLSCTVGATPNGEPKCAGRRDLACEEFFNNGALVGSACLAYCADDSECGTRKCNIGTGQCVDSVPAGLPIGSGCMANVMPDPCNGFCYPLEEGMGPVPGFCSAPCRGGRLEGCGYRLGALDASTSVAAACAIRAGTDYSIGDLGFCLQMCDQDSDCLAPDFECDLDLAQQWNHGICFPKPPSDAGTSDAAPPTPDADTSDAGAPPPDAPSAGD